DSDEVVDFVRGERGGGLVGDEELGVVRERPGRRYQLLSRGGEVADLVVGRDLRKSEPVEQRGGLRSGHGGPGEAGPRVLVTEEDVLRARQAWDEVQLLVHRRDRPA